MILEHRVRLFLGFMDRHVEQSQPTTGVPALDPEPKIVNLNGIWQIIGKSYGWWLLLPLLLKYFLSPQFFLPHTPHWMAHSFSPDWAPAQGTGNRFRSRYVLREFFFTVSLRSSAFLNVMIPEKEIKKPKSMACFAIA